MIPILAIRALALIRATRWAQIALAVLAALAIALVWLKLHDKRVIERHDAPVALNSATATAVANANDTARALASQQARAENEKAIADAVASHPAEVRRAVGPATRAVTDRLRERQSTRRPAAP